MALHQGGYPHYGWTHVHYRNCRVYSGGGLAGDDGWGPCLLYTSRERVERALISLGTEELEKILEEQGGCELTCQFCDKVHTFTAQELQTLIDGIKDAKKQQ